MYHYLLTALFFCVIVSNSCTANAEKATIISCAFEPGDLQMERFLEACPSFANATSSNRIHAETLGKIINYNGSLYEIRVESFEDTSGILPENMRFCEYAAQNNLLG